MVALFAQCTTSLERKLQCNSMSAIRTVIKECIRPDILSGLFDLRCVNVIVMLMIRNVVCGSWSRLSCCSIAHGVHNQFQQSNIAIVFELCCASVDVLMTSPGESGA